MKLSWCYFLCLFMLLAAMICPVMAGEDVELLDASGNKLQPSQIDQISFLKTCGDCHDVAEKAASVHFNRGQGDIDPEFGDCLTCHLPAKNPFNAQGNITKTPAVAPDSACVSCHTEYEEWSHSRANTAHANLSCYECHKSTGHNKAPKPACERCHLGKGKAVHPEHAGLTKWHIENIACETCHIRKDALTGAAVGFIKSKGDITAVGPEGAPVYHNVAKASQTLGAGGCEQCHSANSRFFFGSTNVIRGDKTVKLVNYKSMGLNKTDVHLSVVRERVIKDYAGWLFVLMLGLSVIHYAVFGPRRVHTQPGEPQILRFLWYERLIHVTAVVTFTFLAVTGIMLMLHAETPDGVVRLMHGTVGPLFMVAIVGMLVTWWKNGLFVSCDKDWVCNLGGYLWRRGDCPADKFNAGQKVFYWVIVIGFGMLVSITGLTMFGTRGTAASWIFTLHDLAGVVIIAGIIGHVYLSVFANPGTINGIVTGRVPRSWAAHHHNQWLERQEIASRNE